ncbi:MAG: filamentous hemagglutinin N-terminal domain-containing protein, partial [Prosthecobacter sp.]|nr:filamentous hemagglutinin N-terminal domain-containing protein [Prosthecobacter sp.]
MSAPFSCLANPTDGVVIMGNAQIQNTAPGLTTILQSTDRAVIDWQSFSIAAGEQTKFIVPDATSATLNRVLGCDPSILNGSLTSNGHLFLINSNGIIFGKGSTVDVAGLTASTLDIDHCAFMAGGEMIFKGSSEAAVKNAGMIRASTGDVFLIGYQVSNSGTIQAPNGTVGLAAGSEVLIKPVGDERVVVRNAAGSHKKTGVSNSGLIEANVAELKAHNGNVYALAIRNTGRVAATGVTRQGGR